MPLLTKIATMSVPVADAVADAVTPVEVAEPEPNTLPRSVQKAEPSEHSLLASLMVGAATGREVSVVANRKPAPTIAAPATPVVTNAGAAMPRAGVLRCLANFLIPFEEVLP